MTRGPIDSSRGQAHTIDGAVAAIVILTGVLFALQVSVVTPLASSASSQHVGNQLEGSAQGLVTGAKADGLLRPTLLSWNESNGRFHGTGATTAYVRGGPPTAFGQRLNATFGNNAAYNVRLHYMTDDGRRSRLLVHSGTPAENAVSATATVTLYDSDSLLAADGARTATTLGEADTYFAPDAAPGPTYNVVKVEVVVWEM